MAAKSHNKSSLVQAIAEGSEISKVQAERALNTVLEEISGTLKKGGSVTLIGFGSFSVQKRKARQGKNPRTGESIKIAARKVPKFSPGKALKETVAGTAPAAKKAPAKKKAKK